MKPLHFSVGVLALGLMPLAMAADLPDPTRPPDAVLGNRASFQGGLAADRQDGPSSASGPSAETRVRKAPPKAGRLTAVMLARGTGRAAAVIDGQLRHLGDKVDGGTLVAIDASGASLKGEGNHVVRLNLFDRAPEADEATPQAAAAPQNRTAAAPAAAPNDFSPAGTRVPDKEQP